MGNHFPKEINCCAQQNKKSTKRRRHASSTSSVGPVNYGRTNRSLVYRKRVPQRESETIEDLPKTNGEPMTYATIPTQRDDDGVSNIDIWQVDSKYLVEQYRDVWNIRKNMEMEYGNENSSGSGSSSTSSSSSSINDINVAILPKLSDTEQTKKQPAHYIKLYCGMSTGGEPMLINIETALQKCSRMNLYIGNNKEGKFKIWALKEFLSEFVFVARPPIGLILILKGDINSDAIEYFDVNNDDDDDDDVHDEMETKENDEVVYYGSERVIKSVETLKDTDTKVPQSAMKQDHDSSSGKSTTVGKKKPVAFSNEKISSNHDKVSNDKARNDKVISGPEKKQDTIDSGAAFNTAPARKSSSSIVNTTTENRIANDASSELLGESNRTVYYRCLLKSSNFDFSSVVSGFNQRSGYVRVLKSLNKSGLDACIEFIFLEVQRETLYTSGAWKERATWIREAAHSSTRGLVKDRTGSAAALDKDFLRYAINEHLWNLAVAMIVVGAASNRQQLLLCASSASGSGGRVDNIASGSDNYTSSGKSSSSENCEKISPSGQRDQLTRGHRRRFNLNVNETLFENSWSTTSLLGTLCTLQGRMDRRGQAIHIPMILITSLCECHDIDVNLGQSTQVLSPLWLAIQTHRDDIVEILLKKKAHAGLQSDTIGSPTKKTALAYAMSRSHDFTEYNVSSLTDNRLFQIRISQKNIIDSLLKLSDSALNLDTDSIIIDGVGHRSTTLHIACEFPVFPSVVERCLQSDHQRVDVNSLDAKGRTALGIAIISSTKLHYTLYKRRGLNIAENVKGLNWDGLLQEVIDVISLLLKHPEIDVEKKCSSISLEPDYKVENVSPLEFVLGWENYMQYFFGPKKETDHRSEKLRKTVFGEFQKAGFIKW